LEVAQDLSVAEAKLTQFMKEYRQRVRNGNGEFPTFGPHPYTAISTTRTRDPRSTWQ